MFFGIISVGQKMSQKNPEIPEKSGRFSSMPFTQIEWYQISEKFQFYKLQ